MYDAEGLANGDPYICLAPDERQVSVVRFQR